MTIEKRYLHRLEPKNLQAGEYLIISNQEILLDADIVDISYTGIKVKLKTAIASDIVGRIKITMTLPESGASFSVHGILKCQYAELEDDKQEIDPVAASIDDVIFECIELDKATVLIKTQ